MDEYEVKIDIRLLVEADSPEQAIHEGVKKLEDDPEFYLEAELINLPARHGPSASSQLPSDFEWADMNFRVVPHDNSDGTVRGGR